ncbi:MAG: hydrogenase expression/formation protein HupH [Pseudomonadota bacterium]|jgi:hydrogenase-1 operon protein HyaF
MERDDMLRERKVITLPIVGPGSQQEDEELQYLEMPRGMHTYRAPVLPEPEERGAVDPVRTLLQAVCAALRAAQGGACPQPIPLSGLDARERTLLQQVLGEGEVSAKAVTSAGRVEAQEAVFAGVWRVVEHTADGRGNDVLEVAAFPRALLQAAASTGLARGRSPLGVPVPDGVMNGPSILAELCDVWKDGPLAMPHVVNLTLLPFTPADAAYLAAELGPASVTILSRGYGNCRIENTERPATWHLTYYNSQDHIILRTVEVCEVPEVACAAPADFADSEQRLTEVIAWLDAP